MELELAQLAVRNLAFARCCAILDRLHPDNKYRLTRNFHTFATDPAARLQASLISYFIQ